MAEHHRFDKRGSDIADRLEAAGQPDDLLRSHEVAAWLDRSESWLAIGRSKGYGPPFVKIGNGVRYRRGDVTAWLRERTFLSTAEYEKPKGIGRPKGTKVPTCPCCQRRWPPGSPERIAAERQQEAAD